MGTKLSKVKPTKGNLLQSYVLYYCCTPTLIRLGAIPGLSPPSKKQKTNADQEFAPLHHYVTRKLTMKHNTASGVMVDREYELIDMTDQVEDY